MADVSEGLDLVGGLLHLVVGQRQAELLRAVLDGVPAGQAVRNRHVSRHAKVGGIQNLWPVSVR